MWKARNDVVFNEKKPNPMSIVLQTQSHVSEFLHSTAKASNPNETQAPPRRAPYWRPPPTNHFKVNSDAAYSQRNGKGAIGIIIRDEKGTCISASTRSIIAPP